MKEKEERKRKYTIEHPVYIDRLLQTGETAVTQSQGNMKRGTFGPEAQLTPHSPLLHPWYTYSQSLHRKLTLPCSVSAVRICCQTYGSMDIGMGVMAIFEMWISPSIKVSFMSLVLRSDEDVNASLYRMYDVRNLVLTSVKSAGDATHYRTLKNTTPHDPLYGFSDGDFSNFSLSRIRRVLRRYTVVILSYLRRTWRRFLELEALLDLWKGHKSLIVPFGTSMIQNWNAIIQKRHRPPYADPQQQFYALSINSTAAARMPLRR
ncbi:hypothetical protein ARMGADRAFT_1034163 [Armillaria gallica]|uniref:Uncharacterized protein n=1 Tax=Armillaria gallica TaxID=47427 RepID=A0A2H3CYY3_ARMGA|nr:hypothetical protein ARMGADRAFT_1034163 [Armillaria gallica]